MAMKWLFLFIPGVMHDGHYLLVRHAQVNDAATPRVRLGPPTECHYTSVPTI